MFERPALVWLLLASPLLAWPGIRALRSGQVLAGLGSTLARLFCFWAVVLTLAGLRIPVHGSADRMTLVVALDQSRSIAPDQEAWMMRQVTELRRSLDPRDQLAVVGFSRDSQIFAPPENPRITNVRELPLDTGATDLSSALATASGLFAEKNEKRILLLTDGNETHGSALDLASSLSDKGIRVYTSAPPSSALQRVAITSFESPSVVRAGSSFALRLDIESEATQPAQAVIRLFADDNPAGAQQITLQPGINRFRLPYHVAKTGAYLMKATVSVTAPLIALNPSAEAPVSVIAPPRVLMISGNPAESLVQLLKMRGYTVDMAAPRGLPRRPEDYLAYQTVIIANVPAEALGTAAQEALNRYVGDLGGGLIVVGDSLKDSGFHDGPLEKALPIKFVPQPPPPSREPIAVYLLVDRSNSMSYNSRFAAVRDGERIRYAKQAAIALLNQLDDTDYAGVIAFDSEPYVLGHLRQLGPERRDLVGRVERLEPGGGTDFKLSVETARDEILSSGIAVRQIFLLTDGDTNRQYHDHDKLLADLAKQGVPVSTIRIGPDLENLRLLQDFAQITGGTFYRVEDITKLPQLLVHLTHEAQNFKLRQSTRVETGSSSAVLSGLDLGKIPPIDFFAVTEPKDGSEVPLTAHKGAQTAPLLVSWQYELGRSAIFSGDPDSIGSVGWLRWDHYAEFWSQLVSWVAREGDSGPFTLRAQGGAGGALEITAEKADNLPVMNLFCRITGPKHASDIALTPNGPSLYRGESAPLPRGKYTISLMIKEGDSERLLSRREIATVGVESADAAELKLKPTNIALLQTLAHQTGGAFDATLQSTITPAGGIVTTWRPIDNLLIPLAMLMLLADVFIRRQILAS